MAAAVFPKSKSLSFLAIASICCPSLWAQQSPPATDSTTLDEAVIAYAMQLNQTHLTPFATASETQQNLWGRMRDRFVIEEQNSDLVRHYENFYTTRSNYLERIINRGTPYLYHILNEVEKRNMPGEIALLPFIESAFVTNAKSHVGASGIWQFMPKTGNHYGLAQSNWYDGRNDIYAATDAALDYLEYLYSLFNDWSLALAGYNWGEGRVLQAMQTAKRRGLQPTFENLRMPKETRHYVPKLLAVRNIIAHPESFDISLKKIANKPYFEDIRIDHPIDMAAVARLAGIPESEVLALNPGYRVPVWIPQNKRKLLLPKTAVANFYKNLETADPITLLSWQPYRVGRHESLANIAAKNGMSLAELKRINHIRSSSVAAGSILLVSQQTQDFAPAADTVVSTVPRPDHDNYLLQTSYSAALNNQAWDKEPPMFHTTPTYRIIRVKKGMTLSHIARRYGTSVRKLRSINRIKGSHLRIGQKIKTPMHRRR